MVRPRFDRSEPPGFPALTPFRELLQYLEMGYPPRMNAPMMLRRRPKYRQLLNMLALARQRASLTRPQLAELVSASQGFVARYETGKGPSRR